MYILATRYLLVSYSWMPLVFLCRRVLKPTSSVGLEQMRPWQIDRAVSLTLSVTRRSFQMRYLRTLEVSGLAALAPSSQRYVTLPAKVTADLTLSYQK